MRYRAEIIYTHFKKSQKVDVASYSLEELNSLLDRADNVVQINYTSKVVKIFDGSKLLSEKEVV